MTSFVCKGKQIIYIWSKNMIIIEQWPTQSLFQNRTFLWKFNFKFFFNKVLLCTQNPKWIFFPGIVIWKLKAAAFQNILELYHDQQIWGRNHCVNLDNAVLLPPKNALFLDIKPFFQRSCRFKCGWNKCLLPSGSPERTTKKILQTF